MTEAEGIELYIAVRDRRSKRKEDYTKQDAGDKAIQDKLEQEFMKKFQANGTDSLTVRGIGTAYTSKRTSASAADKSVFFDYVREHEQWDLLDIRPLKSGIEEFKERTHELPPGINWSEEIVVNVRRS
ncbi:hypothetical protein ACO0LG_08505 [Undibacterium sp. Ji42W]|uniref:hypothetical protein n=1 Tax=Undibacterium sp. Ji42W TaxID=3413039 RepID=UPI003BEF5789